MPTHHAITVNGRDAFEMDRSLEGARDLLRGMLQRLDGRERYSLIVWAMPSDKRLGDLDITKWPYEYMQCAGSKDALTIEVRERSGGRASQFVLGRPSDQPSHKPDVALEWDGSATYVYEFEVFDAHEAVDLFIHYVEHGVAPSSCALRALDLDYG